ncbi:hypothetical protein ACFOWB_13555 [Chenggangzhangella methanolivorans]
MTTDDRKVARSLALSHDWHQRMVADFPELFAPGFGFECLGGWRFLLREMCKRIMLLAPEDREWTMFSQVKEKFGTLRAYHAGGPRVDEIVDWAEEASERTCDVCGRPGSLRNSGGWYATRCDDHDGWTG